MALYGQSNYIKKNMLRKNLDIFPKVDWSCHDCAQGSTREEPSADLRNVSTSRCEFFLAGINFFALKIQPFIATRTSVLGLILSFPPYLRSALGLGG